MDQLELLLASVVGPQKNAWEASQARWAAVAKPLGSLGLLESALSRIAATTGTPNICLHHRTLLVVCADNGVVGQGVTQTDSHITALVAAALARGKSTVCHMAKISRCNVIPADFGILNFPGVPGVKNCRIRNGTGDITREPAMTRKECVRAILAGADLAKEQCKQGADILLTGEMGIGNTTTSSAVASVLLNQAPAEVTGRGAGLSDAGLTRKISAIEAAIARSSPDPADPVGLLAQLGGLDLAGLCGIFLGAAACRVPVLIDGFISAVAALCAVRLCPPAQGAMLASHVSTEPASRMVLDALNLKPLIAAEMHLGEGGGAVMALPLLDQALAVYKNGLTFEEFGMEAYVPQSNAEENTCLR